MKVTFKAGGKEDWPWSQCNVYVDDEIVGYFLISPGAIRMEWTCNIRMNWVERDQTLILQAVAAKLTALKVAQRLKS